MGNARCTRVRVNDNPNRTWDAVLLASARVRRNNESAGQKSNGKRIENYEYNHHIRRSESSPERSRQ